jgi:hypothetical protein
MAEPTGDYDEIAILMEKHECTFDELVEVYESLNLNPGECERCDDRKEYREQIKRSFQEVL